MASDLGLGVNVAIKKSGSIIQVGRRDELFFSFYQPEISSNTGRVDDIVKGQVGDEFRLLQQQRKRLTNTASSTANSNFHHFSLCVCVEKKRKKRSGEEEPAPKCVRHIAKRTCRIFIPRSSLFRQPCTTLHMGAYFFAYRNACEIQSTLLLPIRRPGKSWAIYSLFCRPLYVN